MSHKPYANIPGFKPAVVHRNRTRRDRASWPVAVLLATAVTLLAGCEQTGTCDLGAAACVDNVAMNCDPPSADEDAAWYSVDCGSDACIVTQGTNPQAICSVTREPDSVCTAYNLDSLGEHARCEGQMRIACVGDYRQAANDCASADLCVQWEYQRDSGPEAFATCVTSRLPDPRCQTELVRRDATRDGGHLGYLCTSDTLITCYDDLLVSETSCAVDSCAITDLATPECEAL